MAILILPPDDGIVVVMTTDEYLYGTPESIHRRELIGGIVREPPAPFYSHQHLVLRVARLLCEHVEPRRLGDVAIAPLDVVLDADRALIVQPDVLFIAASRLSIVNDQIWGAPDLVVEIISVGNEAYTCGPKLEWYRRYGVKEAWLIDPRTHLVRVHDFAGDGRPTTVAGAESIPSVVLPALKLSAYSIFQ